MVKTGSIIKCDGSLFEVVKKYNDFAWQIKEVNGGYINIFYHNEHQWQLIK